MNVQGRTLGAALLLILGAAAACGGSTAAKPTDPAGDALARGIAAHNANKLDEATKDYFEVLFNDPKNKFAFYNLGEIAQRQNRMQAAESYYRLSLEQDPNMASALFNLAIVRTNAGPRGRDRALSAGHLRRAE